MEFIVKRDILDGCNTLFPRGTICKVTWDDKDLPDICIISANGKSKDMDTKRLPKYFEGIHQPTEDDLDEWSSESLCQSIFGHEVELDAWDSDGSPSWFLALDLL